MPSAMVSNLVASNSTAGSNLIVGDTINLLCNIRLTHSWSTAAPVRTNPCRVKICGSEFYQRNCLFAYFCCSSLEACSWRSTSADSVATKGPPASRYSAVWKPKRKLSCHRVHATPAMHAAFDLSPCRFSPAYNRKSFLHGARLMTSPCYLQCVCTFHRQINHMLFDCQDDWIHCVTS